MSNVVFADNAYATLAVGITATDSSITFTSGQGARFPTVASPSVLYCCLLNVNNVLEEIQITAHSAGADSANIVRAVGGTTAKAWSSGDRIEARLSSSALAGIPSGVPSVFKYLTPAQITDVLANTGLVDTQAAITLANASETSLWFPPGTYLLNSLADANAALRLVSNRTWYADNVTFLIGASLNTDKIGFLVSDTTWTVGLTNVSIKGSFTLNGNRANRSGGSHAGIGILVSSGDNIYIENPRVINCPSDGIEVAGDTTYPGSLANNVKLQNPYCDNNYRNGLSVVGTRGFRCINGWFSNTNGASPQAGVDCEPNGSTSPNVDFEFVNTRCIGNSGNGFLLANSATGQSGRIFGLVSQGNTLYGYNTTVTASADVQLCGFSGGSNGSGDFSGANAYDYLQYSQGRVANAYCQFNGTGSPVLGTNSYNISTAVRLGTGTYAVTFATGLPHVPVLSGACTIVGGSPTSVNIHSSILPTTASCVVVTQNAASGGTLVDSPYINLTFF